MKDKEHDEAGAARTEFDELRRVAELVDSVGHEEPPATLVSDVMQRVATRPSPRQTRPVLAVLPGGFTMTRKVLVGVSVAAAIVLAVFVFRGYPPVKGGAEGAVGAAKRYQAAQIDSQDVVLGDASAQQFMQSDEFARLLKDKAAMKLLTDPAIQLAFRDTSIITAMQTPEFIELLRVNGIKSLSDVNVGTALKSDQFIEALRSQAFIHALDNAEVNAALENHDIEAALKVTAFTDALAGLKLGATLQGKGVRCDACLMAISNKEFLGLIQNASFVALIQNSNAFAALTNVAFVNAVADNRIADALSSEVLSTALRNHGFVMMMQDTRFADALQTGLSHLQQ
jgi:hypothetical protein